MEKDGKENQNRKDENEEDNNVKELQSIDIASSHSSNNFLEGNYRTTDQPEELTCSFYISRAGSPLARTFDAQGDELSRANLEEAIRTTDPLGSWQVSETSCGLIATFARETDAEKLLQRGDLARIFHGPVQVARFSARDSRYRQAVLLRDVPWAIPLQDLNSALTKQGIEAGSIERSRQYVRVEILEPDHYEALLRRGLDFFGAARFSAIPERWWRHGVISQSSSNPAAPGIGDAFPENSSNGHHQADGVLQCYRCQGFWHVAANCRHLPRCVRCGEPHSVEFCPRPRNNPVCCHCSGPHHAAYRQCPVRLQLLNATPISITLSTSHIGGQYPMNSSNKTNASPQGRQPLKPNHS